MPTGDSEVSSHHTVAYQMTSVEDDDIMRGISCIMFDVENRFPCPSAHRDQLKEVPQRDVNRIIDKLIEEALVTASVC